MCVAPACLANRKFSAVNSRGYSPSPSLIPMCLRLLQVGDCCTITYLSTGRRRKTLYLGHQMGNIADEKLQWAAQLGVQHIACENRQGIEREDGTWDVQGIKRTQQRLANWGITMDVLALALPSVPITRQRFPHIMLGTPERDAEIEVIKQNIRVAGEAGVP